MSVRRKPREEEVGSGEERGAACQAGSGGSPRLCPGQPGGQRAPAGEGLSPQWRLEEIK